VLDLYLRTVPEAHVMYFYLNCSYSKSITRVFAVYGGLEEGLLNMSVDGIGKKPGEAV
jgi:hypothetical protein